MAKILIYQQKLIGKIPIDDYLKFKMLKPGYICLPEYFFNPDMISFEYSLKYMSDLSKDLNTVLIGGTTLLEENGKNFNSCYVFQNGREIGHYRKINLFHREVDKITPGNKYKIFNVNNKRIGLLICADVLHKEAWLEIKALSPDIVFIPTFSPYKNEDVNEKYMRDEKIFLEGAKLCRCPVVKVCGIGTFKGTRLQGRSLVADENKIIWRVKPEDELKKIVKVVEIAF